MNSQLSKLFILHFFVFCCVGMLTGCASISRGVAEAIIESQKNETGACYIRGRPIEGIQASLRKLEPVAQEGQNSHRVLKVLMVHGIGSHLPGYSTRMAENLARSLDLTRVQEQYKEFDLSLPVLTDKDLGTLRCSRYLNSDSSQEMIFFELNWNPIVEKEKKGIALDISGEYSFRRAPLNNTLKIFVNDALPDVLMYNGSSRQLIQQSVAQSLCWMMASSWDKLPNGGVHNCIVSSPEYRAQLDDEYVLITHSLGSRVTVDALQWIAEDINASALYDPAMDKLMRQLQHKRFTFFMLSNQLPLLQLGQAKPEVHGRIDKICGTGAPNSNERLFEETHLVAVSDPNDLFSYAISSRFLDDYLDSRICPTLTNVILNVAKVVNLFGVDFANPLAAHTEYDNDERIIGLITKGIGNNHVDPTVARRCNWLETLPEK